MKSQLQQLSAALGATCLLAGCIDIPDTVTVNVNVSSPGQAGQGQPQDAIALQAGCGDLVVQPGGTDTHLTEGQKIKVTGPDGMGIYRLHPIPHNGPPPPPPHQLVSQPHPMFPANNTGHDFTGVFAVRGGPHGNVTQHLYQVVLEFDPPGCASRAEFDTMKHTDASGGPDHGGHAIAD